MVDAPQLAANLRNYLIGFSPNMREVLDRFDFDNTISKLNEAGLLFQVVERFKNVDLHPDHVDNPTMGLVFEELIRARYRSDWPLRPGLLRLRRSRPRRVNQRAGRRPGRAGQ